MTASCLSMLISSYSLKIVHLHGPFEKHNLYFKHRFGTIDDVFLALTSLCSLFLEFSIFAEVCLLPLHSIQSLPEDSPSMEALVFNKFQQYGYCYVQILKKLLQKHQQLKSHIYNFQLSK